MVQQMWNIINEARPNQHRSNGWEWKLNDGKQYVVREEYDNLVKW